MDRLAKLYKTKQEIKASEAAQKLGLSSSSFLRLMKWGLENNQVQKTGKGIYTVYFLI